MGQKVNQDIDAFVTIPKSTLRAMLNSDIRKPELLAQILWAYSHNGGKLDELFEANVHQFVQLSINQIRATLEEFEYRFENSYFDSDKILKKFLRDDMRNKFEPDAPIPWPWTVLKVDPVDYQSENIEGNHRHNAFYILGYRTGKTKGMHASERKEFMDWFYMERLPTVITDCFGEMFGEPETDKRLRKMVNTLAQRCVKFKMSDAHLYRYAIADFEEDLRYLKSRFYKEGSFPWPPTN